MIGKEVRALQYCQALLKLVTLDVSNLGKEVNLLLPQVPFKRVTFDVSIWGKEV